MLKTLVLDGTYQPISILPLHSITWEAAVTRVLNGTCHVISEYDELIKTKNLEMRKPAVIVRLDKIKNWERKIGPSAEAIYYRDGCKCQYCGIPLTIAEITRDHVIPESKGGPTTFDNLVLACQKCNQDKGSSMGKEWTPARKPWTPTHYQLAAIRKNYPVTVGHASWIDWLGGWNSEVRISS